MILSQDIITSVEIEDSLGREELETNSRYFLPYNSPTILQLKPLLEQSLMLPKSRHKTAMANAGLPNFTQANTWISSLLTLVQYKALNAFLC